MGAGAILRGLVNAGTKARLGHVQGQQDAEAARQAQLAQEAKEAEQLQARLRQEALLKFQLEAPMRAQSERESQHTMRLAEIEAQGNQARQTASARPRSPVSGPYQGRTREQWLKDLAEESKVKGGGRATANRPMPTAAVEKLVGIDNLTSQAEDVTRELESAIADGVDVTGRPLKGALLGMKEPGWFMDRRGKGGDRGQRVRALMNNMFATLAKERGGSALSEQEIAILEGYMPNKDEEEPSALIKAQQFIAELKRMKATKEAGYARYGYGAGATQASPEAPDLSDADLYEQLRDEGLSHEEAVQQIEARKQ